MTQSTRPPIRVIARLDIKGKNLIKGIQMEGLRVLGDPNEFARRYYAEGIDEILYIDTVASLYGRSYMTEILENTASDVFVPITAGGGVKSVEDVRILLRSGADKVAVSSEAVRNPRLISEMALAFGEQCTVVSIQAKKNTEGNWEVLIEGGREKTGLDVIEWAAKVNGLGAGEILVTSVDKDGTKRGFDRELAARLQSVVQIPVIAGGGFGSKNDLRSLLEAAPDVNAVSIGTALHYKTVSVSEIKSCLIDIEMRES